LWFDHFLINLIIKTYKKAPAVLQMQQCVSSGTSQFARQRRALDEPGAGAYDGDDFHLWTWVLLTIECI
jgi:hypothetical protein